MGWIIDEDHGARDHEGWTQVLDTTGNVVKDATLDEETAERCRRDGAYWRATDTDGWTSPVRHPIPPGWERKTDPPPHVEDRLRDEWEQHVYAHHPLARVAALTRRSDHLAGLLRELADELGTAVRHARAQGASWTDVGGAAGTTKQAAWERWKERGGQA